MKKIKINNNAKVGSSQEEVIDLKNQLARALADYDNLRKRVEKEKEFVTQLTSYHLTLKLLPFLDMLRKAQEHLKDSGLSIVILEFEKILTGENLEEYVSKKGDIFDENVHEAVQVGSGGVKGTISESLLSGWRYKDGGVLRVEKVKVFN